MLSRTLVTCALVASGAAAIATPAGAAVDGEDEPTALYLVTLTDAAAASATDATLATVGSPEPVYRWTNAIDGYAVRLTPAQAETLAGDPQVAAVERDSVRPVAGFGAQPTASVAGQRGRGGAGVVIGMVDTGLWPDSPLFADVRGLGRAPRAFSGTCESGPGWTAEVCDGKVVGARWYVEGFGSDRIRTSSSLSPLDDDGHGTLLASVAAGNAGVSVTLPGQSAGQSSITYSGAAPQARLAVYKACWSAPDPHDDGCSTADLVSAVDQAVADGVDVLNLAVEGPASPDLTAGAVDILDQALLGAAEADIVVVAASGNRGSKAYAAHAVPWVTSVGGTTGRTWRGAVLGTGLRLEGAMAARAATEPARLVVGAQVPAADATSSESRFCLPGSLDAARVADRVVVCERGRVGRVDKSGAVRRADGVAMVLVNTSGGQVTADFHSVPTVHLAKDDGRRLLAWLHRHPDRRVVLEPSGVRRSPDRLVSWTSSGDPRAGFLAPDLVATAVGVLGATPPGPDGLAWDLGSGTSVAAARVSGIAAALLSRHDWPATTVRSALATTAGNVAGDPSLLRLGSGRVRAQAADRPGLVFAVPRGDYRAWLDGALDPEALNTPSALLHAGGQVSRTVTNVGSRPMYYSSSASGFRRHRVTVTPAAFYLDPGESATFTVSVASAGPRPLDDGWVTWRGANGVRVRMPVVIAR